MVNNEYIISGVILGSIIIGLILIPTFATDKIIFIEDTTSGTFTDTTVCLNVGTGKLIVKSSTNGNCEIKSLVGSSDISITNTSNTIIIDFNGTVSGESTQCINVGSGKVVIKNSTNGNCFVKSFLAGSGLSISNDSNTITYTNTNPESTVCTNLGSSSSLSEGIYATGNCNFKRLLEGTGILLSSNSTHITITNSLPESTVCTNQGSGSQVFKSGNCDFRTLSAGTEIILTQNTNDINIASKELAQKTAFVWEQITKTNLPTTYTDIWTAQFNMETLSTVQGDNATQVFVYFVYDFVGSGTDQCRFVDVNNNSNVLYESSTFSVDQLDNISGWFTKPSWLVGLISIEMQCKSSNGTNDPIIYGYQIDTK